MQRPSAQTVGIGALGVASLVVGAALGMAAERAVVGAAFRHDPDRDEPYGELRGEPHRLTLPDGVELHVEVQEPPGFQPGVDPTIIFSHGFALNCDAWHYQRRDLAGLGRLVVYDQRSHGRSDRAPNGTHTIDQLGHDLAVVLADTAPTGPVLLVGHSMGGMTVMSLVHHYPELIGPRVKGVALIATSPGAMNTVSLGLPRPAATLMHRYAEDAAAIIGARQPIIEPVRSQVNDLVYLLTKIYSFGGWSSRSMTKFVADMTGATPVDVIGEFIPTLVKHDKLDSLELLQQIPTLVLVGDHDLLTPVQHSEEILRKVPNAEFVMVAASGHMVLLERHAAVNLHLRNLVQRALTQ